MNNETIINNETTFNGGPYLVQTNKFGAISQEYGWASLKIIHEQNNTYIQILCSDRTKGINETVVYGFSIGRHINIDDKIHQISRLLRRGFNTLYNYNFSKIEIFTCTCKEYFKNFQ